MNTSERYNEYYKLYQILEGEDTEENFAKAEKLATKLAEEAGIRIDTVAELAACVGIGSVKSGHQLEDTLKTSYRAKNL